MADDNEDLAESQWREAFRRRIKQARGVRTQEIMAELLGISSTAYSKYEGARKSMMPTRLLPRFCKICGVSLDWLIEGKEPAAKSSAKRSKTERAA